MFYCPFGKKSPCQDGTERRIKARAAQAKAFAHLLKMGILFALRRAAFFKRRTACAFLGGGKKNSINVLRTECKERTKTEKGGGFDY